jgi:hypothetical protein
MLAAYGTAKRHRRSVVRAGAKTSSSGFHGQSEEQHEAAWVAVVVDVEDRSLQTPRLHGCPAGVTRESGLGFRVVLSFPVLRWL